MFKKSPQKLVLVRKLFRMFLTSKERFPVPSGNIIYFNEESELHEELLPACWTGAPVDPVASQSREGNLLSLSGPSIPKAQIVLGRRFSIESILQPLFTYLCLPASSSDLWEREQG